MNNIDFSIPQRQSPKGLILFFAVTLKNIVKAIWPVAILFLFKHNSLDTSKLFIAYTIIGIILVLVVANTILYFMNFYFYIRNNELFIEKGFLKKVKIIIPLDKIQTINTRQNLLQQFLKVVTLEIDTAGSSQKEARFISLTRETADALQETLSVVSNDNNEQIETEESGPIPKKRTILHLNTIDLIKVGFSENHLKSLVVIYLFVNGIYQQLRDIFKNAVDSASNQAGGFIENSGAIFITIMLIISLLLLIAFSILLVILRYFDLRFSRQDGAFVLKSGLINKKDILIPFSKIQVISWSSNPLRKLMDFVSVHIIQASNEDLNKKQAIIIPGCNKTHLATIQNELFPQTQATDWTTHKSHPMFFVRLWIIRVCIIAIPLLIAFFYDWQTYAIIGTWVIISGFLSYVSYTRRYLKINTELLQLSKGCIGQHFSMMFNFKIQTITYNQTIFQRRRKTASISIFTSGGMRLRIPYLQEQVAMELYNYLLYCTESTIKKWM